MKCPFCGFTNIYVETINHHIRYTRDSRHEIDLNRNHLVTKIYSSYGDIYRKELLNLQSISCLFCNYKEQIEFDLSLHMIEEHRQKLLQIPISRQERRAAKALSGDQFAFLEGPMEYRLDKAVKLAKEKESERNAR